MKKKYIKVKKINKIKAVNHNENNVKININLGKDKKNTKGTRKPKGTKKAFSYAPQFGGNARVISTSQPLEEIQRIEDAKERGKLLAIKDKIDKQEAQESQHLLAIENAKSNEDNKGNKTLNQLFISALNMANNAGVVLDTNTKGNVTTTSNVIIKEIDDKEYVVDVDLTPEQLNRNKEVLENLSEKQLNKVIEKTKEEEEKKQERLKLLERMEHVRMGKFAKADKKKEQQ